jgi:AcrR family transcriptional regulator
MARMALDERRERLVQAALAVVKREGVAGATTRAIVAEAGMPLGAFHYAFGSRDELLGAVVEAVADMDRMAAEPALASGSLEPVALNDLIRRGMDLFLEHLATDPYAELAFLELTLHGARQDLDDGVSRRRYSVAYSAPEYLLARSARLCGREWTVPLHHAARLLVNSLDGITLAYLADHDLDAARASAAFHADALAGLSRPSGPTRAATATATSAPTPASTPTPDQEN